MRLTYAFLTLTALLACQSALADQPEYFRRDGGVFGGKQPLPDNFADDADRVWRTELPPGNSTPCVHGDSIFLTTWDASKNELATVALDRVTGELRWRKVVPAPEIEKVHSVGSPASSSPACNGKQVFAFFGSYGLLCYDLAGELLWEKKMGPFQDEFGASSSPILADGLVVLNEDHDVDSFLIAIDQDEKLNQLEWDRHASVFARAQNVALAVQPGGRGDVTEKNVKWTFRRALPTVPSSVIYEGVLYMVKDSGIITSLDASDGKLLAQGRCLTTLNLLKWRDEVRELTRRGPIPQPIKSSWESF